MKKMAVTLIALSLLLETAAATVYAEGSMHKATNIGSEGTASRVAFHTDQNDLSWRAPVIQQLTPAHGSTQIGELEVLKWVFSEDVEKGRGNLILRDSNGTVVEQTAVTSRRVDVEGRNVDWELRNPLQKGKTYNIQLDYGTFEGELGDFAGLDGSQWSFSTTVDMVAPQLVKLTPSAGEKQIAVDANLSLQFTEEVWRNNGEITITNVTRNSVEERIDAASQQITGEGTKTITINPNITLRPGEEYLVTVTPGTFIDRDRLNYPGLHANDNWRFTVKPAAGDMVAPVLQQVQMSSSKIIKLTYNEKLNESSVPPLNSFSVVVNGEVRPLKGVSVTGSTVNVELSSGIAAGQIIVLSYTPLNGQRVIEDAARNAAPIISGQFVENGIDNTAPKVTDASVSGSRVTLQFSEKLASVSDSAASQFVVYVDNSAKSIRRIEHSGSQVTLIMNDSIASNKVVQVSYTQGYYPLKDEMGNALQSFQNHYVRGTNDSTAPIYQSASVKGNLLTIQYNEPLSPNKVPLVSHFSVLVNQQARYVDKVEIIGNQVVLTLRSAVSLYDALTLTYVPGDPRLSDIAGNAAAALSFAAVSNSSDNVAPVLKQATAKGSVVSVQFSEKMRALNSTSAFGTFYVYTDGALRNITGSSLNGDTVSLVVDSPITAYSDVKVTYMPSGNPLQDESGNTLQAFINEPVSNQSDVSAGRPADMREVPYEWFLEDGMYAMTTSGSSTSTEQSNDNQRFTRYKLSDTKLKESFRYAARSGSAKHLLVDIPSSERKAMVDVPLAALEEMKKEASNGRFSVRYGDVLYTLPLNTLNVEKLKSSYSNQSNTSIYVVFSIEQGSNNVARDSITANAQASGARVHVQPYTISLSSYNHNTSGTLTLQTDYEVRLRTTGNVSKKYGTVVKYDSGINGMSYTPNTLKQSGSTTVFKFKGTTEGSFAAVERISSFIDTDSHWARTAIEVFASKSIIDRTATNRYGPNVDITRGEFASLLARSFGLKSNEAAAYRFNDLGYSHRLAPWIGAATEAGIINGYTDGTFKPNSKISREQMAVMIIRAMEMIDTRIEYNSTVLNKFKDRTKISGYAREAVIQAISSGLLNGVKENTFDPGGNATRAQAVVMVQRLLTSIDYLTKY